MLKRLFPSLVVLQLLLAPVFSEDKPVDIKPYDSVITSSYKSKDGLFKIHQHKDKLYYEIPKSLLDKDFLLVTQVAKTKLGVGWGGDPIDERVVRWHRRDNKILLLDIDYGLYADPSLPIHRGVEAANNPAILFAFPIEAVGEGEAPVIEVSRMFVSDSIELTPKYFLGAKIFDATRCFLDWAKAFPENIEVESSLTLGRAPESGSGFLSGGAMAPGTATVRMHYSMIKLPSQPMMARLRDSRVGFFSQDQYDYGRLQDQVKESQFICRWRLEKKDTQAEVSEPIKPIVFYIDAATPTEWVPYIKKGVESWQPAFEEAGFKNAILAKEAPTDDPDWSPEDARYSVIRWLPSTVRNAYGPHVSDPRSGEILEADIHMFHNIIDLQRTWYFTQVGPLDPRAHTFPLPTELMGSLIQFVVAHEVGHSLGLEHNMKASSMYPAAKVRDREWVKKMGHCPSIMDYSRFNYVAQPEDHIDLADLIPRIGPYDRFAIRWGYKPVAGATTSEQEKTTLDSWAREQDKTPWLRFSTPAMGRIDPGDQTESVGDADAVYATTYGLKNIRRVLDLLPRATSSYGESFEDLRDMYGRVLWQWRTELAHVVPIVGGVDTQEKHAGQTGPIFTSVSRQRQAEALKFLLSNAFQAPPWLLPEEVLTRISPESGISLVAGYQKALLADLLSAARLRRLAFYHTYPPEQYMRDLRLGIFREFYGAGEVRVAPLRRRLQAAMIDDLSEHADATSTLGDEASLSRLELNTLALDIDRASKRAVSTIDKAHAADLRERIRRSLDPRVPRDRTRVTASRYQAEGSQTQGCWDDYPGAR